MLKSFKKLVYGARVLLSKGGGEPETIEVAGRPTVILHGGEGPAFVYLHSTLGESQRWLPFHQGFAKQFRVLAPVHPGFGESGFDGIDTIEDMAFHYVELFDALGLEDVILGGVSLGGWIAAEFAVRWPERVRKLWICNAPGLWVADAMLPDLFAVLHDRPRLRELLFHDTDGFAAHLVINDQPDEQRMMTAYQSMTVLARLVWERPYDPKLAGRLHRVQCPTLLLWSQNDQLVPPAFGKEYMKYLPQAQWREIADCGHLLMFEKEKEFVDVVTKFCQE
ncbi:MAG: alpha/beta fold hydrolase [Gemmataceae bacterium]